jgi:hypothetical protein
MLPLAACSLDMSVLLPNQIFLIPIGLTEQKFETLLIPFILPTCSLFTSDGKVSCLFFYQAKKDQNMLRGVVHNI